MYYHSLAITVRVIETLTWMYCCQKKQQIKPCFPHDLIGIKDALVHYILQMWSYECFIFNGCPEKIKHCYCWNLIQQHLCGPPVCTNRLCTFYKLYFVLYLKFVIELQKKCIWTQVQEGGPQGSRIYKSESSRSNNMNSRRMSSGFHYKKFMGEVLKASQ